MVIKKPKKQLTRKQKDNILGISLVSIHFIGFALFVAIPLIMSFIMAFSYFPPYRQELKYADFCGFDNFVYMFTEADSGLMPKVGGHLIWKATGNTLFLCLSIPFEIFIALLLAQLLRSKIKCRKLFRVIFYLPYVCSTVAIAFVWGYIFSGSFVQSSPGVYQPTGLVNQIIRFFNPKSEVIDFQWAAGWTKIILIFITIWTVLGRNIVLLEAGLNNVDTRVYEAAEIDGAGKFTQFFKITMPLITPTIFYLLITSIIGALQSYVTMESFVTYRYQCYGENNSAITIVAYIMWYMNRNDDIYYKTSAAGAISKTCVSGLGVACAATLYLTVLVAIITFINNKLSKKWVYYDD